MKVHIDGNAFETDPEYAAGKVHEILALPDSQVGPTAKRFWVECYEGLYGPME